MSVATEGTLKRLSELDLSGFNETDVREAFLAPLIDTLGYIRGTDYTVLTEEQYQLNPFFLSVGSKRIKLDYRFTTYRTGFWLLEAKQGVTSAPKTPSPITDEMIGQAHFYAHHREVDCPLFGVSNGWFTNIYDRDGENPLEPILSIPQADLVARYLELYALIGFDQVTFGLKRRLLTRIQKVLSADVDLSRGEEFVQAVMGAAASARPKVLENFRKAASGSCRASRRGCSGDRRCRSSRLHQHRPPYPTPQRRNHSARPAQRATRLTSLIFQSVRAVLAGGFAWREPGRSPMFTGNESGILSLSMRQKEQIHDDRKETGEESRKGTLQQEIHGGPEDDCGFRSLASEENTAKKEVSLLDLQQTAVRRS